MGERESLHLGVEESMAATFFSVVCRRGRAAKRLNLPLGLAYEVIKQYTKKDSSLNPSDDLILFREFCQQRYPDDLELFGAYCHELFPAAEAIQEAFTDLEIIEQASLDTTYIRDVWFFGMADQLTFLEKEAKVFFLSCLLRGDCEHRLQRLFQKEGKGVYLLASFGEYGPHFFLVKERNTFGDVFRLCVANRRGLYDELPVNLVY